VADKDKDKAGLPPANPHEISPISIEEEMRTSYLSYA
jgi:DNA gyrase/topoisomerase IV subunit A